MDQTPEPRAQDEVRAAESARGDAPGAVPAPRVRRERTGPRQFLREVRGELKRVAWPSRKEVASYSLIVLVTVTLLTAYIFGLDQLFGQLVLTMFGQAG